MCRSIPLFLASLAFAVAVSKQLGNAEASPSASEVALHHDEAQVRSEEVFAREASLKESGRRFRTSLAIASLVAAVAALVFVISHCFRGLESKRTFSGQGVVARRLAWEDGSDEEGEGACAPGYGFFGGVPVAKDGSGSPVRVLVYIQDGKPFFHHPKTEREVPLIVKHVDGVGLMLHEAGTHFDLEWLMYHPDEPKPSEGGESAGEGAEEGEEAAAGGEEEKADSDSSSSDSEAEGGEEDRPKAERIVYKPPQEEWTHEENPEFPYVVFISGMPFQVDANNGELQKVLLETRHGELVFMHPVFGQPMKLGLVEGDLRSSEGFTVTELVEKIKEMGPP
ncbi:uncharacterized protein EMH_0070240 [Eimeria mitis]|uniref:Transmembrane protein n=1 Tax=Eimeria mitis TaxID=44415 RepID=U6KAI8_9EIME|nr:uncharacterized protein EMH_0070240 [Eimeria mitis]CDJ35040.1 hypothetical protein EMH_0070240 [Eimeria mitis]